ncbi:hypothetical protein KY319_04860 [Candidatus Woesearchaeota archaeon]|nr:hypothetical protein [Candidatus Woesearchaeota archaeon]
MADTESITKEELAMLNTGLSPSDGRYITNLSDPRLAERIKDPSFLGQVQDLFRRTRAGMIVTRQDIDNVMNLMEPTGRTKVAPKQERDKKAKSLQEFLEEAKSGLRHDQNLTPDQVKARIADIDRNAEHSLIVAPHTERIRRLQYELGQRNTQLARILGERKKFVQQMTDIFGPAMADRLSPANIADSIKKILKNRKQILEDKEKLESLLESVKSDVSENSAAHLKAVQKVINTFLDTFNRFPMEEGVFAYNIYGRPVINSLSSNDEIVRVEGSVSPQVVLNNENMVYSIIEKTLFQFDKLFNDTCFNLTNIRGRADALKEELKRRGVSEKDIEIIAARGESVPVREQMDFRRQVDESLEKMSGEEIAALYLALKRDYESLKADLEVVQKQRADLAGRKGDIVAVIGEVFEIEKLLERAGRYAGSVMGSEASTSKSIESVPQVLKTLRGAVSDVVEETEALRTRVGEKEKQIAEQEALIAQKDKMLGRQKRVNLISDPVLKKFNSRFAKVYDVFTKYSVSVGFTPDELQKVSMQTEEGFLVLINNYLSVLNQMKRAAEVVIVEPEADALKAFEGFVKCAPGRDVHAAKKYFAELIDSEAARLKKIADANRVLVPALAKNITIDALLENTKCQGLDGECLLAYVKPLHEKVVMLSSLPEKQKEIASRYGFDSFDKFKEEVYRLAELVKEEKSVFVDARKLASAGKEKPVKTKEEAVALVRRLKSSVDAVKSDGYQADFSRKYIEKNCLIPGLAYEQFAVWVMDAYNRLQEAGFGSNDDRRICGIAKRIDGSAADYDSSIALFKGFVDAPAFKQLESDLGHFAPLKDVFGDFASGADLVKAIDKEIRNATSYLKAEENRISAAKRLLE